jgi:hypothetical protein
MTMEVEPAREMVAYWVGAARAMLGDAPNYSETPIEMEVKVGESPERFAFVLQRVAPEALTPHQARQRAEAERDQHAAAVRAECDAMEQAMARGHASLNRLRDHITRIRTALDPAQLQDGPTAEAGCAYCGKHVRRISGTLATWWVHDPGAYASCHPQQPNSPRATPAADDTTGA